MNVILTDKHGDYLGSLGTSQGIIDMMKDGPPALKLFLSRGIADEALAHRVIKELKGNKELAYVLRMFKAGYYPIRLVDSNSIGDAKIVNDPSVAEGPVFYPEDEGDGSQDLADYREAVKRLGGDRYL